MKISYKLQQGTEWIGSPSVDAMNLWNLLPDLQGERFRLLVDFVSHIDETPYCLVAKDDGDTSVIVESLGDGEARSLVAAYLTDRREFFAAAAQSTAAMQELVRRYLTTNDGLLANVNVRYRSDVEGQTLTSIIDKVRHYRMQTEKGLRIIASDHFFKEFDEVDPDMCLWDKVPEAIVRSPRPDIDPIKVACVGAAVLAAVLVLFACFRGCGSDEPQKKTEPIGQPRAVQREPEQPAGEQPKDNDNRQTGVSTEQAQPSGVGEAPRATIGDGVPATRLVPEQPAGEQPRENDNGQTEVSTVPGQTH